MIITTPAQIKAVKSDIQKDKIIGNEKVWSYLIAHILDKSQRKANYFSVFCGEQVDIDDNINIWYEAEPMPPRKYEGNTKLDLAFGSIGRRGNTNLGIEYSASNNNSWVCFVEAKYFSDCSTTVKNDTLRNQIARVIENLLCFQADTKFPDKLYFTLLTPRRFLLNPKARLYGYKMDEYKDYNRILYDINLSDIEIRRQPGWEYPNLEDRLNLLNLNWISYEYILEQEFGLVDLDLTDGKWKENNDIKYIINEIYKLANDV